MKRIHLSFRAWLVSLTALLAALPACADVALDQLEFTEVAGGYSVKAKSGETLEGALVIPDTYGGKPVVEIGDRAFFWCTGLTSVHIGDGVTTIGQQAFLWCDGLTQIEVSEANTAYCSIDGVLYNKAKDTILCCPAGRQGEFSIPETVTTIGYGAFESCHGLTSITIPDAVTTIGNGTFYNCSGLTSVHIGNGVTTIDDDAFWYCSGLTQIEVSEANTAYCSIDGVLYNKAKDTILCCPGGRQGEFSIPETVTTIGSCAFFNCFRLTNVHIPSSVTTIGEDAFSNCYGLRSITIPDGVTTIGSSAFCYCHGLTSITIPDAVTTIGDGAFYGCSGLTQIEVSEANTAYCSIDGVVYNKAKDTIHSYPAGRQGEFSILETVTTIGGEAFHSCTGLTSITIPDGVTTIGGEAFSGCSGLTSVTIPDAVTTIGSYAFSGCSGLTSVHIPSSVTTIGSFAFCYCSGLTEITCSATTPPYFYSAYYSSFDDSHYAEATVYVPEEAVEAYQQDENWSRFQNIVALQGDVYCTIDSYDRGGSLTVTGADLPVEHVARSLASYWRIDRQDGGGVKLYNMYYGKYLNFGDKKVNDEGSVFYLVQTSEQRAVGGFALCKNPSISGNDCIDANNYNSGVGNWSPSSSDWKGTTWMIGRMTAADLSEVVKDYIADNYPKAATAGDLGVKAEVWDAAVDACDTWAGTESDEDWNGVLAKLAALALDENGVWPVYAIENCSPAYGTGNNIIDDVDGGQPHFRPANTVDDRMLWIVRGAGKVMTVGEYAMVNYHTRKPLRGQEAVSVTPTTDEVQAEGQFLLKLGGNVQHAQESGSLVVTWNNTTTANSASAWRFHYAGTTEELAGYGDIYAEGRALQDAILASAGIKNSVGTHLGQYGNMTAGQYAGLQENAQNVLRGKTPESFDVEAAAEAAASISGLSLNLPKAGQLLRIRSARTDAQPYLGSENSVHKTGRAAFVTGKDGENELATIFYYDGTTLTNLATGYRLRNNSNFVDYNGIVEGTKIGFQAATNGAASKYNVLFNGGARSLYTQKGTANSVDYYFTDAAGGPNTPTGDVAYTFTLEEVESLPVTVTEAGMATLYAPVSLGVPEGVTAYTVTVNESQMLAELSPVENIPAGTGVVLEAEAGVYRFELTEDEAGKIGALEGSVATQSYESGSIYILAQGNGKTGFYRMNSTTDTVVKGCKAYLPAARTAGAPAYIFGRVVTGIAGAEEAESDAAVYGLDGRRVSRMSKGLYIVGGKKVLVK